MTPAKARSRQGLTGLLVLWQAWMGALIAHRLAEAGQEWLPLDADQRIPPCPDLLVVGGDVARRQDSAEIRTGGAIDPLDHDMAENLLEMAGLPEPACLGAALPSVRHWLRNERAVVHE